MAFTRTINEFSQNPIVNEDLFQHQYIYEEKKQKQGVNDYYSLCLAACTSIQ
jgi:hypothetical protein